MPILYVLVGVPGAGKSTYIKNHLKGVILSTDDYIEKIASETGKTYNEVFSKETMREAISELNSNLSKAIFNKENIIWDQTNLSVKKRASILAEFKGTDYEKIAVVFPTPNEEEWKRRLNSRPGKTIPIHVLNSMAKSLEYPTIAEGFDRVVENGQ